MYVGVWLFVGLFVCLFYFMFVCDHSVKSESVNSKSINLHYSKAARKTINCLNLDSFR